jgi:glycosyltransferase involved in cell wall biosynthesis
VTTLSIVVPLFDKQAFVAETIASLAAQEVPPDELIVVDDASTDASADAAEQALARHADALGATRVALVRLPRNAGPGAARNAGIELAESELIFCLDADDRLRPDALRLMRAGMEAHALAMAVVGYTSDPPGETFPDRGALDCEAGPLADEMLVLADPLRAAAHPEFVMGRASNVVVRRRWLGAHRYCTDARLNEGVDLWYRVLKDVVAGGGRVGLFAAPLIRFRISGDSLSHRPLDDWRALEVPPTVRRYRDSADPHDRRMTAMLVERWTAHALAALPEAQRALFLARHRELLAQMETQ